MYQVKRAIIMAAGFGSRMQPITLTTPKPLVKVNGVRMIDTVIQALHANGIFEIYVVVGHLKEEFQGLEEEYAGLRLLENPYYDRCNNISSLYVARDYLEDAIILEGDLIIRNAAILRREFTRSGYNGIWTDTPTKEWLMQVEDNIVQSCSRLGGERGWQLFGVSRWTAEDGKKLKRQLEIEFEKKKNYQIYWDDVVMFCYPQEYELGVLPMHGEDIVEIDSLEELIAIDDSYRSYAKGGYHG